MMKFKKKDKLEFLISDYAFQGKGIAKVNYINDNDESSEKKFVVFINGAYPGDKVIAELRKVKKSFAEAKLVEVISPSDKRTKPYCKYFTICGGCKQQDLQYKFQLKYKAEQVLDSFIHIGKLKNFEVLPIIPSERQYFYRNKMEFSFSDKRWLTIDEINSQETIKDKNFALGLHIPKIYDKVLDIDECFLQSELSNKILNFTRSFFKDKNISIYSTKTHQGYLRNLIIKTAHHTNDIMVNLVTFDNNERLFTKYKDELLKSIPEITTIINNINLKKSQTSIGDFEKVYFGDGYIFDKIDKFIFRISANSFFQTNTLQAEKLYKTAMDFAMFSGDEFVYDLYAGAGTISVFISENVKKVFAFENVESALRDAKANAELNNIENIDFILSDLNKSFLPILQDKNIPKPDVILADPPRSGMNPKTVKDILKLAPQKIIYISCNPTTQARDINMLVEGGYNLIKIQPVDLFPQTFHIENVALMRKSETV